MKRLWALLLAMLLPACAFAETYGVSMSLGLDETVFIQAFKQIIQEELSDEAINTDALAGAAARTLNGIGFSAAFQRDAALLQIQLAGSDLADLSVQSCEDGWYIASSLLGQYVLKEDAVRAYPVVSGERIADSALKAISDWWLAFEPVAAAGVFSGDAYEGGTRCKTWMISDIDVAALVSSLASNEMRYALSVLLNTVGLNGVEILSEFDRINEQVADANRFSYMLRIVTDDADQLVGISLGVYDGQTEVATLSLGTADDDLRMVVGLGLKDQNYWWEFDGKRSQHQNNVQLSGVSREWIADKAESFSYVKKTNAPVSQYQLTATVTQSGNRWLWDGSISPLSGVTSNTVYASSGMINHDSGLLECNISLGDTAHKTVWMTLSMGPAEQIVTDHEAKTICSITDPADAALLDELASKTTATLLARLIKLLPMDLIMTLNQFTLP